VQILALKCPICPDTYQKKKAQFVPIFCEKKCKNLRRDMRD
jgi:endogenous inhibitor of DNA gyrase (YacG/DUF329 family)